MKPVGKTCWVTGAGGLIGSALVRSPWRPPDWEVIGLGRPDLELTDSTAVRRRFEKDQPEVVIHSAALSRGPSCEAEPDRAWRCNVEVVRCLAELCGDRRFLLMSTDLVFDGRQGRYREEDAVNPLTVYARTKVAAEERVRALKGGLVVRTSLNHGRSDTGNRAFNEEMLAAWRAGRRLKLFTDEFRNPIGVPVTVRALWELAQGSETGVLHVAGEERLSRWEIGERLAEVYGVGKDLMERSSLKDYVGAPRSPDTSLDSGRARGRLGFRLPGYSEWLREAGDSL